MGQLTWGHLHLTAYHVDTDISLRRLHKALSDATYPNHQPAPGWGHVDWERDDDGARDVINHLRQMPGLPSLHTVSGHKVLLARFMYDTIDKAFRRNMPEAHWDEFAPSTKYTTFLVDVVVVKQNDGLLLILATHDDDERDRTLSALGSAADGLGDWSVSGLTGLTPPRDLFMWLIYRGHKGAGSLAPDLKLSDIRSAQVDRTDGKKMQAWRGVDLDRVEIAGPIAKGYDVGPAKIVLYDSKLKLLADINYLLDGSFDLHRNESAYDSGPMPGPRFGVRATIEVATVMLPKLVNAYNNDSTWAHERSKFREECRKIARDMLEP